MNARSSPSTKMATTMACSTNAAGLSLQSLSKMDAIAQSETRVGPVLYSFLIGCVSGYVLAGVQLKSQSATVCLRSESPDLIHLREIFRARGEEYISGKPLLVPMPQGKSKARIAGRAPFSARSRKGAARACRS